MPVRLRHLQLFLLMFIFAAGSLAAQEATEQTEEEEEPKSKFKDPEDGKFDVSQMLLESLVGFMPIPIIITEPAVDNGLGIAGAFFHKPKADQMQPGASNMILPNISVLGGAYTGNDSWFVGGGHFRNWSKDRFRYNVMGGYANINLDWYGNGNFPVPDDGLKYFIEGGMLDQTFLMRIGESRWYMGPALRIVSNSVTFDLGLPIELDPIEDQVVSASAVALYEDLDFRLGPRKGLQAEIKASFSDDAIGSDYDYEELSWQLRQYFEFADKYFLSWRFDGATTSGDVPFYMEPDIDLEGIPAMRYQGPTAATVEVRGGIDVTPRWSLLGFVGAGRTADSISDMSSAKSESAYGAGFRYLLARKLGMRAGIDVAKGPEETYWYLIVGADW